MEPSCTNLSLPRFASNRHGFELAIQQGQISTDWFRQLTTQATAVKERRIHNFKGLTRGGRPLSHWKFPVAGAEP